jgi:predicted small lipoprotein YifL
MRLRLWLPAVLVLMLLATVLAGCGKGGGY